VNAVREDSPSSCDAKYDVIAPILRVIFDELFSPEFMAAYRFVMKEYDERMKEPAIPR
jgi:hypothetical protein